VDNFVIVTKLAINTIFVNAELFNTSLQQARDSAKQFSRIGVNAFTTFQQTSSDTAALGYSAAQLLHNQYSRESDRNKTFFLFVDVLATSKGFLVVR
jgi:hypothetical protein